MICEVLESSDRKEKNEYYTHLTRRCVSIV